MPETKGTKDKTKDKLRSLKGKITVEKEKMKKKLDKKK